MWHRLAGVLGPWYEQIHRHCLDAGVLHADETGWRVEGRTWWLWCFATTDATFYLIDESRGHPALDQFFVDGVRRGAGDVTSGRRTTRSGGPSRSAGRTCCGS